MNNASIREYYLKLLARYSLLPTFILILLLSIVSIVYDNMVAKETLQNTLQRNKSLADQILQNFEHSTGIVAKSSFSAIALRFGDFTGYRSVVVPWISDDKTIEGIILFDQNQKPVLTWPSQLSSKVSLEKIKNSTGVQTQNETIIVSHDVFDNTERLGSLAFVTGAQALGLNQLNLKFSDDSECLPLSKAASLVVCSGGSNSQKILFSITTVLISTLGLLIVFFFSISRLAGYLSLPVNALHTGLSKTRAGETFSWKTMFDSDAAPIFRPIGEHFSETISQLKELNLDLNYKRKLSDMAKKLAHDIRSPVSALNIAARSDSSQQESAKELMMSAIQRINDITPICSRPPKLSPKVR